MNIRYPIYEGVYRILTVQAFLFLVVPVVCLPASLQGLAEKNTGAKRG